VTVTLADEIDVSRGDTLVHEEALPSVGRSIEAMMVWMNERPMAPRAAYLIKHGTKLASVEVHSIHERVDVNTLERHPANKLGLNDIGRVTLTASRPLLFDAYAENHGTGAFILIDRLTNATLGAGMILGPGAHEPDAAGAASNDGRVSTAERLARLGQRPAALVFVGGEAAHREDLAHRLERRLWDDGYTAHVLGSRDIQALPLFTELGLISLVVAEGPNELAAARAAIGAERVFEVRCGEGEGAESVEGVLSRLREAAIIR
jgi:bifunctional enzyme CysN/CysC